MKRVLCLALLLGACNHTQPGIEVRTVEVPTPVACVSAEQLETAESTQPTGDLALTGDANKDLPIVAARGLDWKAYALDMLAIVKGCADVR